MSLPLACNACGRIHCPPKYIFDLLFTTCGHLLCDACKNRDKDKCLVCKKPMDTLSIFANNPQAKGLQTYFVCAGKTVMTSVSKTVQEHLTRALRVHNWQTNQYNTIAALTKRTMQDRNKMDALLKAAGDLERQVHAYEQEYRAL